MSKAVRIKKLKKTRSKCRRLYLSRFFYIFVRSVCWGQPFSTDSKKIFYFQHNWILNECCLHCFRDSRATKAGVRTGIGQWTGQHHPGQSRAGWVGQFRAVWGLSNMSEIWFVCNMTMGSVYPLSEHVDIFPVRLVSTFHRVFSVYLTLAVYLTYPSLSLRAE